MNKKHYTPEEIINTLRQAESELSRGVKIAQVCRNLAVTESTYYLWTMKRLKKLEKENERLKRLVAESFNAFWTCSTTRRRFEYAYRKLPKTRECLGINVERELSSDRVLERLAKLFTLRGPSEDIRSDNGPEFTAEGLRGWLEDLDVRTIYIELGSAWENGDIESPNGELFDSLL